MSDITNTSNTSFKYESILGGLLSDQRLPENWNEFKTDNITDTIILYALQKQYPKIFKKGVSNDTIAEAAKSFLNRVPNPSYNSPDTVQAKDLGFYFEAAVIYWVTKVMTGNSPKFHQFSGSELSKILRGEGMIDLSGVSDGKIVQDKMNQNRFLALKPTTSLVKSTNKQKQTALNKQLERVSEQAYYLALEIKDNWIRNIGKIKDPKSIIIQDVSNLAKTHNEIKTEEGDPLGDLALTIDNTTIIIECKWQTSQSTYIKKEDFSDQLYKETDHGITTYKGLSVHWFTMVDERLFGTQTYYNYIQKRQRNEGKKIDSQKEFPTFVKERISSSPYKQLTYLLEKGEAYNVNADKVLLDDSNINIKRFKSEREGNKDKEGKTGAPVKQVYKLVAWATDGKHTLKKTESIFNSMYDLGELQTSNHTKSVIDDQLIANNSQKADILRESIKKEEEDPIEKAQSLLNEKESKIKIILGTGAILYSIHDNNLGDIPLAEFSFIEKSDFLINALQEIKALLLEKNAYVDADRDMRDYTLLLPLANLLLEQFKNENDPVIEDFKKALGDDFVELKEGLKKYQTWYNGSVKKDTKFYLIKDKLKGGLKKLIKKPDSNNPNDSNNSDNFDDSNDSDNVDNSNSIDDSNNSDNSAKEYQDWFQQITKFLYYLSNNSMTYLLRLIIPEYTGQLKNDFEDARKKVDSLLKNAQKIKDLKELAEKDPQGFLDKKKVKKRDRKGNLDENIKPFLTDYLNQLKTYGKDIGSIIATFNATYGKNEFNKLSTYHEAFQNLKDRLLIVEKEGDSTSKETLSDIINDMWKNYKNLLNDVEAGKQFIDYIIDLRKKDLVSIINGLDKDEKLLNKTLGEYLKEASFFTVSGKQEEITDKLLSEKDLELREVTKSVKQQLDQAEKNKYQGSLKNELIGGRKKLQAALSAFQAKKKEPQQKLKKGEENPLTTLKKELVAATTNFENIQERINNNAIEGKKEEELTEKEKEFKEQQKEVKDFLESEKTKKILEQQVKRSTKSKMVKILNDIQKYKDDKEELKGGNKNEEQGDIKQESSAGQEKTPVSDILRPEMANLSKSNSSENVKSPYSFTFNIAQKVFNNPKHIKTYELKNSDELKTIKKRIKQQAKDAKEQRREQLKAKEKQQERRRQKREKELARLKEDAKNHEAHKMENQGREKFKQAATKFQKLSPEDQVLLEMVDEEKFKRIKDQEKQEQNAKKADDEFYAKWAEEIQTENNTKLSQEKELNTEASWKEYFQNDLDYHEKMAANLEV